MVAGPTQHHSEGTHSLVAGCFAGVVGCIVGHPFDTIKLAQHTLATEGGGQLSVMAGYRKLLAIGRQAHGGRSAVWWLKGLGPALAVQVLSMHELCLFSNVYS